jgi:hypothetical protein
MNEYQRQAAAIKARITSLRSRLSLGIESYKTSEVQRDQDPAQGEPPPARVAPKIEPDWDAIAKLTAENDAKEAKANELDAMRAKLLGKK